jgi:NAD(P)-dependent dehydrogenase (short-subunit alcohol dehydrogenase family)
MKVENQVILITGASSGIGHATALELSTRGNTLVLVARRESLLAETAGKVRGNGSECSYFAGDALDKGFAEAVVAETVKRYGRIDIAQLGIGIGPPSNTLTAGTDKILKCMDFNYRSFINFWVPLIRQMKAQKSECMISNVNSLASFFGIPMQGDYVAAKGAIRLFMETARMEMVHFGISHIRLQTIHPGFVDTLACKDDGVPETNLISEEMAAKYIVKGYERNKRENMFPAATALPVRAARRILPSRLVTKVQLGECPKEW